MSIPHRLLAVACLFSLFMGSADSQPVGFSPCTTTPASISATTMSSNVALTDDCGTNVILFNVGNQEAFWAIGSTSGVTAATSGNSLPGNTGIVIVIPTSATWIAAITASSSTTIRVLQGTVH